MNKPLLLNVLCSILLLLASSSYAQTQLTTQQWQEDLRFLQSTINNDYPFLFKKVSKETFNTEVEKLYNQIPNLTEHEVPVAFARIVSLFEYGHTLIPFSTVSKRGCLPINLYHFSDGVYVEGTTKEHLKVLGAKVIKIGDTPIEQALELVRPVVPVENESYFKAYGIRYLTSPDVLFTQRVISTLSEQISLTLEKDGKTFEYALSAIPLDQMSRDYNLTFPNDRWVSARNQEITPLYLKHIEDKFYYFEYLEGLKTVYVRQSSVFNDESESLKDFYARLFAFIDENDVQKLIYDVRLNGGGNNYNNPPLIKGLLARPHINKKGNLFYIIGRNTFSACQNLTNEIKNYTEAIMVGEPTAENVNFYGDNNKVTFPNSGLTAYLSFAWWQDMPVWENSYATVPHLGVEMTFEEYVTNQDPALETAMNFKNDGFVLDPLKHLTELFTAGQFAQVQADAIKFVQDPAYKFVDFKGEFSKSASRLMESGRFQEGSLILGMIMNMFPEDEHILFDYADSLEKLDKKGDAKSMYEKLLSLNPDGEFHEEARQRIKAIEE